MIRLVLILQLLLLSVLSDTTDEDVIYTNSWSVQIDGDSEMADTIAASHGFINKGQVGSLTGYYHFMHADAPSQSKRSLHHLHSSLSTEDKVLDIEQQTLLKRHKRDYVVPTDPMWNKQWYMHRTNKDMNLKPVWEIGITGKGSVVSILDDGIEHSHPDLEGNYDPDASYDFNSHDNDPFPRYDSTNENKHGTRCAGEVSAIKNDVCTVGVAYKSSIGGIRMLDGAITDIVESSSLSLNPGHIQIYSSSWGPDDDGRTVDGPGKLAKKAFIDGITKGRDGLGSLFVWASGNGGALGDSCNCDGYAVSPYTLAISSVTENDRFPWYAEECSSNLACTYSSGSAREHQVISTDLHHKCTSSHTGTSASAPMAAGLLALMLEANRNLTWRDVQYIIVYSSNPNVPIDINWATNGAGLKFSHKYGFGLMDASALVNRARHWNNVPTGLTCNITMTTTQHKITASNPLHLTITDSNCSDITFLEHVQAYLTISIDKGKRGQLYISLQSPQHTTSILLPKRRRDSSRKGFDNWPFMTVFSWGENPVGEWVLSITADENTEVTLTTGTLVLHGVQTRPRVIREIPIECSDECKDGCAKSGPEYCDTCKHYRVLSTLECVSECPKGTYLDETTCRPCLKNCTICTNDSLCIECEAGTLKLSTGICLQKCPASTFEIFENHSCYECHASCLSCTGPTPLNCTQCLSSQYHLTDGACIQATECTPGRYYDSRSFECRPCHNTCAECDGRDDNNCNACYPGRVLTNGKCVVSKSCQDGEYYSEKTMACATCPPSCSECADVINCITCNSNYYLHRSRVSSESDEIKVTCVKNCPSGYYGTTDNYQRTCATCPPYCGTCNAIDYCLTCTWSGVTPREGVCPQPCGAGEFYNVDVSQCQSCDGYCDNCINKKICSSCKDGRLLSTDGTCVKTCSNNTVADSETGRCESTKCHESCATCTGPEPDQCLSCQPHRAFLEQSCVDSCPDGQVLVGNGCINCDSSCVTCAGVTDADCLSCNHGDYLDDHTCVSSCRHGTYIDDTLCLSCPSGCLSCSNSTHCNECDQRYVLYDPSNMCLTNCPTGYYKVDKTCQPCIVKDNCITTNQTNISSSSFSSLSFVLFLIIMAVLIVSLVILLLLWKRETVVKLFYNKKGKYRVLYSAPDKLDGTGEIDFDDDSQSETEVFASYRINTPN